MEQTQPQSGNRSLLYALIGGGFLIIILIVVGVVVFTRGAVQQRQSSIPELLNPDTAIYGTITPALSDIPGAARIQSAYPELFVEEDSAATDEQLQETLGVTYADIQSWLGTEIAFAVNDLSDFSTLNENGTLSENGLEELPDQATIIAIAASTNAESAQAFLDKQRTYRSEQGEEFSETTSQNVTIYESNTDNADMRFLNAFALVGDYVVFASEADAIVPIAERQAASGDSLANNSRFTRLRDQMSDSIGYIYIDGVTLAETMLSNMQPALDEIPPEQASRLQEQAQNLRALQSIGLSVSIVGEGIELDAVTNFDLAQFDEEITSQLEAMREPVDETRLQRISGDAVALMTFKIPANFKDQVMDAIAAQPEGQQSLEEFEEQFDMNLEQDFLDWFAGDASLVILPPDPPGLVTLTSMYFSIQPQEQAAAEAGMEKIASVLELVSFGMATLGEEEIGGTTWNVFNEAQSNEILGGYGFVDENMVIAIGSPAMENVSSGNDQPITENSDFTTVTSNLYSPNGGIAYFDVDRIVSTLDELGAGATMDPEAREVIEPIQAIGIAGEPGLSEDGTARAKVFVLIRGE